jgi:hypothetical protein
MAEVENSDVNEIISPFSLEKERVRVGKHF